MRKTLSFMLRMALLLPLLAGAVLLHQWSRNGDPRFYLFLSTPPGRLLARVCRWPWAPIAPPGIQRLEAEMTEAERAVKRALSEQLRATAPSHRVVLSTGKVLTGRVLGEDPESIRFEESYGDSGALALQIRRGRIQSVEPLHEPVPEVSYRDVLFQTEFPEMNLYKRAPYTIVTDEKYFRVERTVRILQALHADFVDTFGPVITRTDRGENIQVLFFSREEPFKVYQGKYAPRMESSVGFYSPFADRFVVFNQRHSQQLSEFNERLEEEASRYRANQRMYGGTGRIEQWKREAGQRLSLLAEEQTRQTIRHEGAHQLFFTYGVHSAHRIENEWLYEGLAVYCETKHPGDRIPVRVQVLQSAARRGELLPLAELVNRRSSRGLFSFGPADRVEMAYSQAWALVHMLTQPGERERFFDYICYVRDRANFGEILRLPRYELLCRALGRSPERLEREWQTYLENL